MSGGRRFAHTHTYRPPTQCPVCGHGLTTTRLGCAECGTELVGSFASCPFCALDEADLDLLKVFLTSRGNLKELEKHLQVSYPTARARFNAVLDRLGWLAEADAEAADEAPSGEAASALGGSGDDAASAEPTDGPAPTAGSPDAVRDQVLAQVAAGLLSPGVAADLLGRLR